MYLVFKRKVKFTSTKVKEKLVKACTRGAISLGECIIMFLELNLLILQLSLESQKVWIETKLNLMLLSE